MTYNDLIFDTYFTNAIHSAIVVDDEFPTYDLLTEQIINSGKTAPPAETAKWDYKKSQSVYNTFTSRNIPCDIEYDVTSLAKKTERLRKSDLVVLDYQLITGSDSSKEALEVIQQLSQNDHFNIIIVNTNNNNLNSVWIEIALTMKNDFPSSIVSLKTIYESTDWVKFDIESLTSRITSKIILAFIENNYKTNKTSRTTISKLILKQGVRGPNIPKYVDALIFRAIELMNIQTIGESTNRQFNLQSKCDETNNIRWILNDKVFVVIKKKQKDQDTQDEGVLGNDDPEKLISTLKAALCNWQPSPIQLLMSNIQNTVEQGSLSFRLDLTRSYKDQAAWLYHALKKANTADQTGSTCTDAFSHFNTSISETVKGALLNSERVKKFQRDVLCTLKKNQPEIKHSLDIIEYTLGFFTDDCSAEDIIRSLNFNLSCLPTLENTHITTGTIFKNDHGYWVCSSPACELEPSQTAGYNDWLKILSPHRPMIALKLKPAKDADMEKTTNGNLIFADDKIWGVVDKTCGLPSPELFVFENTLETNGENLTFTAFQLNKEDDDIKSKLETFTIVAQLRPEYAGRLLQKTGVHMSRIGVDFENFPSICTD
ncbi:MAG: hypothetical protein COA36_17660 [Desulfotalea sp.]|nr:MAG: hypothetical protein COA36_17660 [Desulfotalea sp.]